MSRFDLRPLGRADGPRLAALHRACPIEAELTLWFDRGPDFFAWPDAVFASWSCLGAFVGDDLVGGALLGESSGREGPYGWLADARVHPDARRRGVGEALVRTVVDRAPHLPYTLFAVKRGNTAVETALATRGGPRPVATLDVRNVPLFAAGGWPAPDGFGPGGPAELDEAVALFAAVHADRPLAPPPDALPSRWSRCPWWVVRRAGRLVAVGGGWDLGPLHGARVLRYGARARALKLAWDLLARVTGGAPLPPPGEALRVVTVTTWAARDPEALRALVAGIGRAHPHHHLATVATVGDDPLAAAFTGLRHQRFPSTLFVAERAPGALPPGRPFFDEATL